jgi:hypothetical protein
MDRKAGAVDQDMDRRLASGPTDGEFAQLPGTSRNRGVVGSPAVQIQHREQRAKEPLCWSQAEMEDRAHGGGGGTGGSPNASGGSAGLASGGRGASGGSGAGGSPSGGATAGSLGGSSSSAPASGGTGGGSSTSAEPSASSEDNSSGCGCVLVSASRDRALVPSLLLGALGMLVARQRKRGKHDPH